MFGGANKISSENAALRKALGNGATRADIRNAKLRGFFGADSDYEIEKNAIEEQKEGIANEKERIANRKAALFNDKQDRTNLKGAESQIKAFEDKVESNVLKKSTYDGKGISAIEDLRAAQASLKAAEASGVQDDIKKAEANLRSATKKAFDAAKDYEIKHGSDTTAQNALSEFRSYGFVANSFADVDRAKGDIKDDIGRLNIGIRNTENAIAIDEEDINNRERMISERERRNENSGAKAAHDYNEKRK